LNARLVVRFSHRYYRFIGNRTILTRFIEVVQFLERKKCMLENFYMHSPTEDWYSIIYLHGYILLLFCWTIRHKLFYIIYFKNTVHATLYTRTGSYSTYAVFQNKCYIIWVEVRRVLLSYLNVNNVPTI